MLYIHKYISIHKYIYIYIYIPIQPLLHVFFHVVTHLMENKNLSVHHTLLHDEGCGYTPASLIALGGLPFVRVHGVISKRNAAKPILDVDSASPPPHTHTHPPPTQLECPQLAC